jgi:hypothetical protein
MTIYAQGHLTQLYLAGDAIEIDEICLPLPLQGYRQSLNQSLISETSFVKAHSICADNVRVCVGAEISWLLLSLPRFTWGCQVIRIARRHWTVDPSTPMGMGHPELALLLLFSVIW